MTRKQADLRIPVSLQRQAGIKSGDRLQFLVSPRTITITAIPQPAVKPTKAELVAIRRGEAAIGRGEVVSLTEFLHEMDRPHRKARSKTNRKVSR